MAHSMRRSSYGGVSSSKSGGGYGGSMSATRHHNRASANSDDYYGRSAATPHHAVPHTTHHHQQQHHHHNHHQRRSSDRYDSSGSTAALMARVGSDTHHTRVVEDYVHHTRNPQQRVSTAQAASNTGQTHYEYQDSPTAPATPPSIMHVGMKIPLTEFFPGTKGVVSYTPDSEMPVDEHEPIEAGRLPKKSRQRSESVTSTSSTRRDLVTDDSSSLLEQFEGEDAARDKRKEEAYKTALCDAYRKNSECSYGKQCRFAHGEHELRLPPQPRGKAHPKYKTQLCDKFSVHGYCPYGPRCQYIHMMKKGLPLMEYERKVRSGKISPTNECVEFIDEDDMESSYTRNNGRPYTVYQVDNRRYSKTAVGNRESRRRSFQDEYVTSRGSRYEREYETFERGHRHRSMESLNADAPRVSYEKIATTPRRAPHRPKELSLIHEETEEYESPPASAKLSQQQQPPAWVTHLMSGGAAPSPRAAISGRVGSSRLGQIAEHDEHEYSEEHHNHVDEAPRRSTRA